jgi:purine nucleosidase
VRRVLIDTDRGVDDSMMLQIALGSPSIQVVGLTTVFGNGSVDQTTRNALINCEVADRMDIPVAKGAGGPLLPWRRRKTGTAVHGKDVLGNSNWPDPSGAPIETAAALFLVEQIEKWPGELTVLAVGSLTNLAIAVALEPSIAHKVKGLVVMGGAIGHAFGDSAIEFNLRSDPESARIVFQAGWPLTIVPLDVTTTVEMTRDQFERIRQRRSRSCEFLSAISPFYFEWCRSRYQRDVMPVHDATARAYILEPSLFKVERLYVDVAVGDDLTAGLTVADFRQESSLAPNANVCRSADSDGCLGLLMQKLLS